jgi:hypothetical protein
MNEFFKVVRGRKDWVGKKCKVVEALSYGMVKVEFWDGQVVKVEEGCLEPTTPFRTRRELTSSLPDPIAVPENDSQ